MLLFSVSLSIFTAEQQTDDSKYDIEHLATKKLMRKKLEKYKGSLKLPISSIGNLCLLPEFENRSKGEKTLYEDSDYLKKSNLTITEIEDNYSFTTQDSLAWASNQSLTKKELQDNYLAFINGRFEIMLSKLLDKYDQI